MRDERGWLEAGVEDGGRGRWTRGTTVGTRFGEARLTAVAGGSPTLPSHGGELGSTCGRPSSEFPAGLTVTAKGTGCSEPCRYPERPRFCDVVRPEYAKGWLAWCGSATRWD